MALFKPLVGTSINNVPLHEGWVYFCQNDGKLYFDALSPDSAVVRYVLNAELSDVTYGILNNIPATPADNILYWDKENSNFVYYLTVNGTQTAKYLNYQTPQTTLAGYGITDAKIQNGSIILGSNSLSPVLDVTGNSPIAASVNSTTRLATITHATSGVTAGTYTSVTVNAYGHVTAGTDVAVQFVEQSLTTAQQTQARTNISAASTSDLSGKVSIAGDTMTGALTISNVDDTHNGDSVVVSGNVIAGGSTKTAYSMVGSVRKCANDSGNANSSVFFVNSDGTAKFCHKRGITTATDDAYMLFDATGFTVAYSGTKGGAISSSQVYTMLDTNNGYLKTSVDDLLGAKAPLASPAFTGVPTAPTAAEGTDTTQIATTAFVQAAVGGGGASVTRGSFSVAASATSASIVNPAGAQEAVLVQLYDSSYRNCWAEYAISASNITFTFTASSSARTFYYAVLV